MTKKTMILVIVLTAAFVASALAQKDILTATGSINRNYAPYPTTDRSAPYVIILNELPNTVFVMTLGDAEKYGFVKVGPSSLEQGNSKGVKVKISYKNYGAGNKSENRILRLERL